MIVPEEYITGNPGMDAKIAKALEKEAREGRSKKMNDIGVAFMESLNRKTNKYGVAPKEDRTYKDGTIFASKREMERWEYLLLLQRAGEIKDLRMQTPFVLQEAFEHHQWGPIQKLYYVSDFDYINVSYRKGLEGKYIVEDSKGGVLTSIYKLKKRILLRKYPEILFFEV